MITSIIKFLQNFTKVFPKYGLTIYMFIYINKVLQLARAIILKHTNILLAINFFLLGTHPQTNINPSLLQLMKDAHQLLFVFLSDKTPYSIILERMHASGYKCTPDDLIFWGKTFVDARMVSVDHLNNDLGYCEFSPNSAYNDIVQDIMKNPDILHKYYPNTPRPYTGQQSYQTTLQHEESIPSDSSSDMDITWDFSELYSLIGFMGTLIFSITFALVFEYIKGKFDSKNSNNDKQQENDNHTPNTTQNTDEVD